MNFEARFEARQGGRTRGLDEDLKRVNFDKLTTKTMSGDVGFSASEGLKELLNLEAFQKPTTESHPVTSFALRKVIRLRSTRGARMRGSSAAYSDDTR